MSDIKGYDKAQREYEDRIPEDVDRMKFSKHKRKHFNDDSFDVDSLRDEIKYDRY